VPPITSIIPCKVVHGEPFPRVEVIVNQRANFLMYISTSTTSSVVSPRIRDFFQLRTQRRSLTLSNGTVLVTERAMLRSLEIATFPETRVTGLRVYVRQMLFLDGLIGLNYLAQFQRVCYDFAHNHLLLTRESST
jgi:hypothetical protein